MADALTIYFDGEKYAGLLLAGVAVGVIVVATFLFRSGSDLRAFAITLGVVALAEIALGVGLYVRTSPQVARLEDQLQSQPSAFYEAEAMRMARVQRNFVVIEYVELAVIVAAAAAAIALKLRPGPAGVALGLLISGSMLLAFDVLAERRGATYLNVIEASSKLAKPPSRPTTSWS